MKFRSERKALIEALDSVCLVAPKTSRKPALELVRVEVSRAGRVLFAATDLETWVLHELQSDVRGAGCALIDAWRLREFLRACQGESVEVERTKADGPVIARTSDGETLELTARYSVEDFPAFPQGNASALANVVLPAPELAGMLRRVLPSVARHPSRYAMHAVLIEFNSNEAPFPARTFQAVATDGRRIAITSPSCGGFVRTGMPKLLGCLPCNAARILEKLLPAKVKVGAELPMVEFALGALNQDNRQDLDPDRIKPFNYSEDLLGDALFQVRCGSISVIAHNVPGEFPRYQAVVSTLEMPNAAHIPSEETLRRLKVAATGTASEARAVFISIADGEFRIVARSMGASASATVKGAEILRVNGCPGFGVNPDYFADAIDCAESCVVEVGWRQKDAPIQVRSAGFLGLVMPITLEA